MVGMAEVKVCRSSNDVLMALGLGSCVGSLRVRCAGRCGRTGARGAAQQRSGGFQFRDTGKVCRYGGSAPAGNDEKAGGVLDQIVIALAGGAQLFAGNGIGRGLDIGPRNGQAVQAEIERLRLRLAAIDLGGTTGRTVHLLGSGLVRVKTIGKGELPLVDLSKERARR